MSTEPEVVHYCDWSGQPDIHIACDNRSTTPAWGQPLGSPGPYRDADGKLYAFDADAVTCLACRAHEAMIPDVKGAAVRMVGLALGTKSVNPDCHVELADGTKLGAGIEGRVDFAKARKVLARFGPFVMPESTHYAGEKMLSEEYSMSEKSSNIASVRWQSTDGEKGTMRVTFNGGGAYDYFDVAHGDFRSVVLCTVDKSPGKTLNAVVKPHYKCKKVEPEPPPPEKRDTLREVMEDERMRGLYASKSGE